MTWRHRCRQCPFSTACIPSRPSLLFSDDVTVRVVSLVYPSSELEPAKSWMIAAAHPNKMHLVIR